MATQAQPQQSQVTEQQAKSLLDQILEQHPTSRHRVIDDALTSRIEMVESVLPDKMKGQGRRLVKRAMMTYARKPELSDVPPAEFVRSVIEAAEVGLAIDGKLGHVIPYKNRKTGTFIYQFQPDYKGLIAVAKRTGQITQVRADVVRKNDQFNHGRNGATPVLEHSYSLEGDRGEVIGAYCILTFPDGSWDYDLMNRQELNGIQNRSPAKSGPWATDPDEMRKKTVIKRALKTHTDDPGIIRAMELSDVEFEEGVPAAQETTLPTNGQSKTATIRERLKPVAATQEPAKADPEPEKRPEREAGDDGYDDGSSDGIGEPAASFFDRQEGTLPV